MHDRQRSGKHVLGGGAHTHWCAGPNRLHWYGAGLIHEPHIVGQTPPAMTRPPTVVKTGGLLPSWNHKGATESTVTCHCFTNCIICAIINMNTSPGAKYPMGRGQLQKKRPTLGRWHEPLLLKCCYNFKNLKYNAIHLALRNEKQHFKQ